MSLHQEGGPIVEAVDQIYFEILDSCALKDSTFNEFRQEEITAMMCTAHIVEELRKIRNLMGDKND